MAWKGLGVWEGDMSVTEWPRDLWKPAVCFAGGLHEADWELAFADGPQSKLCGLHFSGGWEMKWQSRDEILGNSAIWHHVGGNAGQKPQAGDLGAGTGSAACLCPTGWPCNLSVPLLL